MEDKTKQKIRRNRTSNVTSHVPEDKKEIFQNAKCLCLIGKI